jgi:hypothetical protein
MMQGLKLIFRYCAGGTLSHTLATVYAIRVHTPANHGFSGEYGQDRARGTQIPAPKPGRHGEQRAHKPYERGYKKTGQKDALGRLDIEQIRIPHLIQYSARPIDGLVHTDERYGIKEQAPYSGGPGQGGTKMDQRCPKDRANHYQNKKEILPGPFPTIRFRGVCMGSAFSGPLYGGGQNIQGCSHGAQMTAEYPTQYKGEQNHRQAWP